MRQIQAALLPQEAVISDKVQMAGVFQVEVIRDGKHGPEVIQRRVARNTVVNVGKQELFRIATGLRTAGEVFDQMRVGTSGAAVSCTDTNVLEPVTATLTTVDDKSLLSATRTFRLIVSYPSGAGSKTHAGINEVAVLCKGTSPGDSMLARATFTAVNKTTNDKLKITYQIRVT
jgi:hypothetical protein